MNSIEYKDDSLTPTIHRFSSGRQPFDCSVPCERLRGAKACDRIAGYSDEDRGLPVKKHAKEVERDSVHYWGGMRKDLRIDRV